MLNIGVGGIPEIQPLSQSCRAPVGRRVDVTPAVTKALAEALRDFYWPTRPIVFVGDRIPRASIWPGRVPPIVALSQVATLAERGLVVDHDAVLAAILEADAMASSPSQEPVRTDQLALMIRRQIKDEEKTQLTDDILVAAYQQEGSVRKAAAFLSERTGQAVTKDKVQNALRRSGGIGSVVRRRNRKSESIRR